MEEKKNNKGLIWLIVILIVLVLGLVGYIIFDKVMLTDGENKNITTTITTSKTTDNDKKVGDCYDVNGANRCVVFKEKNIELEYENNDNGNKYFINDNLLTNVAECDVNRPIVIDKDFVILDCGIEESSYIVFNAKGEKTPLDFNTINNIGNVGYVEYNNNVITTISRAYIGDYEAALCRDNNEDDIVYIEQQTKYQGNGVFAKTETTKTKTAKEIIKERFNMTCEELRTTNDPAMEYHKYLATGE